MDLSGQAYIRLKANPWPVPLPPSEIFLAGLSVATTPCDSVIAFLAARGRFRALHKQAVQAVWIRAEEKTIIHSGGWHHQGGSYGRGLMVFHT